LRELVTFFALAFAALLPLINPVGDALIFLGMVGTAPPSVYLSLAKRIAISTTVFMLVIEGMGTAVFKFFGISLPVMQVSGGFVIAAMGWNLLNQSEASATEKKAAIDGSKDYASLDEMVFYPLTFPITAGPGCIVVMVTLSAHASGAGLVPEVAAHAGIVLAVVLLSIAVYFCYGYAPAITARVRPASLHGILRVIAFVLLCIGVQIAWNGAQVLLKALHTS
jgi:multiple antibiotic resistance protein